MSEAEQNQSRLEERTRTAFERSVADLDARTRSRLNQARQQAVQAAQGRQQRWARGLIPVTGVAAAAVLAIMLQVNPGKVQHNGESVALEDLDIVSDADNVDLMQDIDFYAWMPQSDAPVQ